MITERDLTKYQMYVLEEYDKHLVREGEKKITDQIELPHTENNGALDEEIMIFCASIFWGVRQGIMDIQGFAKTCMNYHEDLDEVSRGLLAVKLTMTREEMKSIWPYVGLRLIALEDICRRLDLHSEPLINIPMVDIVRAAAITPIRDGRFNKQEFLDHLFRIVGV